MTTTPPEFTPDLNVGDDRLQPFDVRDREGWNPMIKLALVAAGLLIAAFIVMKLYTPGVRDRSDPPRITADNTPFKVKPEDVGGVQTPNQDKVVFEVMDGNSPETASTPESRPEAPIKMEAPAPVVKDPAPVVKSPAPVRTAPASRPSANTPAAARGSDWVAQVASTRSPDDAKKVWDSINRKFPRLVSGRYADIKRVDLEAKGIYYRTRIAGLSDKTAASDLCASFKAAGQACFVTKR